LLKKLCSHVKSQREAGVHQSNLARTLLNVEELFLEDLNGLSPHEEETLRRIAKSAPLNVFELGEEFDPGILQTLVHRRLIVRVGNKYDIYWDIFRDYLNTGKIPVQENYILRTPMGSVLNGLELLSKANGTLDINEFQTQANITEKSFYNIAKDIGLLGLAKIEKNKIILQNNLYNIGLDEKKSDLRKYLKDVLNKNRLIWNILNKLSETDVLNISDVASILEFYCPYISATYSTWANYAKNFSMWLDFADLAIYDSKNQQLLTYKPGKEIRERRYTRKKSGTAIPRIQYGPIVTVVERLVTALETDGKIDWTNLSKSAISKSLSTLEDFGLIKRKPNSIEVNTKAIEFVKYPENRPDIFAEGALKIPLFSQFIKILNNNKDSSLSMKELATLMKNNVYQNWNEGTGEVNVKIMLNWSRYSKLAPDTFQKSRKGPRKNIDSDENRLL